MRRPTCACVHAEGVSGVDDEAGWQPGKEEVAADSTVPTPTVGLAPKRVKRDSARPRGQKRGGTKQ